MFDIGMSELLIIGIVALIVVGPKDLPGMFRTLGRFTAKIKAMGREFSRAMENAADEAGVNEIKSSLNAAANPKKFGLDKLKEAASDFENWDPMKSEDTKAPPKPEMTEERAAAAKKISDATAKSATARKAVETADAETADVVKTPVKKAPAKKARASKTPAKTSAKATAAKATARKTAPAKTTATKTAATKTAAAKKTPPKTKPAKTKKEGDA
ncbi:Sec-independent protein translocase protein TatB [Pacificibacter marinus]|uniref:Sec-independent protein translocase protein TatB n=1 Tax=Pacificibacter marinus TaxID=658057 RepID=UPI001C072472|nr:Sec-independent protein translocase protein TatB [Pacificibacter marinus]MBU2868629.1 Sec-independent protein translocase protein TatB [Pacificibacter marinus]